MQNDQMATAHPLPEARGMDAVAAGSAVSWAAILAGAALGSALSIALLVGGSGLGFLAVSPWQGEGVEATTMGIGTIIWLLVTQVIAFGIAGYVTGRLRSRWTDLMVDEITFRDTAHGFLAWAVSALVTVVVLGSSIATVVSSTAQTGAALVGSGVTAAAQFGSGDSADSRIAYYGDALLRPGPDQTSGSRAPADSRAEINRLLVRSLSEGELNADDRAYVVRMVAQRTGLTEAEAEQRVEAITTQARQAMDEMEQAAREAANVARKAAATLALWAFIAMLVGAFSASYAAMTGGRTRDRIG